ncbi:hypothetical protein AB0D34_08920 [Streptomyces sp. NPDC048420]|uniref:hypothetical protein n=1 Tax=Streptomyces sp. NPDC048420 TaxID=3155755 RepID=UPI003417414D
MQANGRMAQPSTTAAHIAEYIGTLMDTGQPNGIPYSPDTLLAYLSRLSRILTWYPKGERPDGSKIRDIIEDYRDLEYPAGLSDQAAALTLEHLLPVVDAIDESTRIGRRDAAALVVGYRLLLRGIEIADLSNADLRPVLTGPRPGVWVRVAKTKTTDAKTAAWRFYPDRDDLRFAARAAAWKADLAELGADAPHLPFLRALTKKGNLQLGRAHATVRGLRLSGATSTRSSSSGRPPLARRSSAGCRCARTHCEWAPTTTSSAAESPGPAVTKRAAGPRTPSSLTRRTPARTPWPAPSRATHSRPCRCTGSGRRLRCRPPRRRRPER